MKFVKLLAVLKADELIPEAFVHVPLLVDCVVAEFQYALEMVGDPDPINPLQLLALQVVTPEAYTLLNVPPEKYPTSPPTEVELPVTLPVE